MKQGNYDVMLNHHEDQSGRHHEDTTHITYNGGKLNSRHNKEKYRSVESYRGVDGKNVQYNNRPSYENTQNYNSLFRKNPNTVEKNMHLEETKDRPQLRSESDNIDDVLGFLNDLDETLKIKGNKDLELRCSGYRCSESRYESDNSDSEAFYIPDKDFNRNLANVNYDRHVRCNGRSCSLDRDDDRSDEGSLRCYGNRCSRKANDRDDDTDDNDNIYNNGNNNFKNILRCAGNDCGLNRNDDDDDRVGMDDSLRCVGDRCSLNRDDDDDRFGIDSTNRNDDDDDSGSIDSLRCIGDRCGINRNDDDRDGDRSDPLRCVGDTCSFNRNDDDDDTDDTNSFRCAGDRCGRNRKDDEYYEEYRNNNAYWNVDERDNLRCIGNRCSRSRNDDDDLDSNRKYEDEDEVEGFLNAYVSRAFDTGLRGYVSPAEKRRLMEDIKKIIYTFKKKLRTVADGTGRYPLNKVNL